MNRTIEAIIRHMGSPYPPLSSSKGGLVSRNGNGSDASAPRPEKDVTKTKNILFIQSSPLGSDSYSQKIADSVLNDIQEQYRSTNFVLRDLSEDPPPHIDREFITAASSQPEQQTPEQKKALTLSDTLIRELVSADIVVIAVPMYKFGVPSTLKTWIDHVVRTGRTFSHTNRGAKGLLHGKRAILILAGGDVHSESAGKPLDFREPYLRAVLEFIGITDVGIIRVARPGALGATEYNGDGDSAAGVSLRENFILNHQKEAKR